MTRIRGLRSTLRNMAVLGGKAEKNFGQGLLGEADRILAKSEPLVPVDENILRTTGRVEGPRAAAGYYKVWVKYGGGPAPYAPYVHEMPETYNFTKPGTGPKFLEKPAMAAVPGMAERMTLRMRF